MNQRIVLLSLILLLGTAGCASNPVPVASNETIYHDLNITRDSADWIPDAPGPWDGEIWQTASTSGIDFGKSVVIQEHAGVPNLLKLQNGDLILTYQYFSTESEELFDVIAYSVSIDEGETWSDTQAVIFENLPEPLDSKKHPMDPTLVQLEDGRLRLYFTYHAKGNTTAALYSATTNDNSMASAFTADRTPALQIDAGNLLDPAVVYFNGVWQHYSWQDGSDNNYHSISIDGVTFTRKDDITLPMDFLGQVIEDNGRLVFYGTSKDGIARAVSGDGYTWEMQEPLGMRGADPAVQKLDDGTYLMVYTSNNFN